MTILHLTIAILYATQDIFVKSSWKGYRKIWTSINLFIMIVNSIQCLLTLYVMVFVDDMVDHLHGPSLPARASKPTAKALNFYNISNLVLILFVIFRDRGSTLIEFPLLVVIQVAFMVYAPFWAASALKVYGE